MNQPADATMRRASMQVTTGRIAAIATALLLVVFLVLSVSRAAFTSAATGNEGNNAATDPFAISLTDDDSDATFFELSGETPGSVHEACVAVTYTSNYPTSAINVYAPLAAVGANDLAPLLNVKIERLDDLVPLSGVNNPLTGLPFGSVASPSCVPFDLLAAVNAPTTIVDGPLSDMKETWAEGTEAFPAVDSTRTFKISVTVPDDPDAAGLSVGWDFVWETIHLDLVPAP